MKKRISSLDALKGIAALFIIWIHEQFPGFTGALVDRIGMFAVPVFFMVSGFFSRTSSREKIAKSIRHTLTLLVYTYALNLARIFIVSGFSIASTIGEVMEYFTLKWLVLWLTLNVTHISGVAWFLFALLYCYIFHWLFHKHFQNQRIFLLIPLCFACGFAVHLLIPKVGDHNAWFMGIPYYLCGQWFRDNRAYVEKKPAHHFVITGITGLGILVLSLYDFNFIYYIGYGMLSLSLFALCIRFPEFHNTLLGRMGSTYSFFIYVGHALMIHVFNAILPVGDNLLLAWTRPVLLAAATIGCAALWHDVIRRN